MGKYFRRPISYLFFSIHKECVKSYKLRILKIILFTHFSGFLASQKTRQLKRENFHQ